MKFLIYILLLIPGLALSEQGTMNSDEEITSDADASLSGEDQTKQIDVRQEEVQLEEDGFDPQLEEMDDSEDDTETNEDEDIHY